MRLLFSVVVCTSALCSAQTQELTTRNVVSDSIERYVAKAQLDWQVPGLAVGIVKDGEVVLSRGFGLCKLGDSAKVDGETLFAIASNTKAFTAAALAALVDEQKLSWDDKVRDYLPYFKLYDPFVSAEMSVRDLLCHRSGLGTFSGDLLWYGTGYSPEEVIRRARLLKPAGAFRASYGYSNLMYLAAGEVVASASGSSWPAFVQTHLIEPVEMDRTRLSVTQLEGMENVATPHKPRVDDIVAVPWINWDAMAAAGGIISCSDDMCKWLVAQLNRGKLTNGDWLFSAERSREMWSPHTPLFIDKESAERNPTTHFRAYGLGWGLRDYKGHLVVSHGGGYDGMFSRVVLVPEQDLGVVVLTNSMTNISAAITNRVVDHYLDGEERDWSAELLERFVDGRQKFYQRIAEHITPETNDSAPSKAMDAYIGSYEDQLYGEATISLEDDQLVLRMLPFTALVADLEHLHYDTFVIRWRNEFAWFEEGTASFVLDAAGRVDQLKLYVPNDDLWFHELDFRRN